MNQGNKNYCKWNTLTVTAIGVTWVLWPIIISANESAKISFEGCGSIHLKTPVFVGAFSRFRLRNSAQNSRFRSRWRIIRCATLVIIPPTSKKRVGGAESRLLSMLLTSAPSSSLIARGTETRPRPISQQSDFSPAASVRQSHGAIVLKPLARRKCHQSCTLAEGRKA